jgi:hypothetical protein
MHATTAAARPLAAPARRKRQHARRARATALAAAAPSSPPVLARWSIDARFGCKAQALALVRPGRAGCGGAAEADAPAAAAAQLTEWVQDIASQAGESAAGARLLAGQLGAPESRLELELPFESLAELEEFFTKLPTEQHAAWGARLAAVVCDGSPVWHVMRVVPVAAAPAGGDAALRLMLPVAAPAPAAAPQAQPAVRRTDSGLYVTGDEALPQEAELDWKGDPIVWAEGDRLPKFQ